ncbi:MAG: ThiF family adenylyltransferase [Candidatus Aenigmatarchaeota archaeon]
MNQKDEKINYVINLFSEKLKDKIIEEQKKRKINIDIFDILESYLMEVREEVIKELHFFLLSLDPTYKLDMVNDVNPIIFKTYYQTREEKKDRKEHPVITSADLTKKLFGFYSSSDISKIKKMRIGIFGIGATGQLTSLLFARFGVENLFLVDGDVFEPSNIGRQFLCFHSTLNKKKVEVTKNFLEDINPSINVTIYDRNVDEKLLEEVCKEVHFLHDAADSWSARAIIHRYGRKNMKICFTTAVEGFEGRYTSFFPDDPSWDEIYKESYYHRERGVHPLVPYLLASIRVNDNIKLAVGQKESIIRYPYFLTINMLRKNPLVVRKF